MVFGKYRLISKHLVAVYKVWYSRLVSLSAQFLIHASSSIYICLVWRICMTTCTFLVCASVSVWTCPCEAILKGSQSPKGVFALLLRTRLILTVSSSATSRVLLLLRGRVLSMCSSCHAAQRLGASMPVPGGHFVWALVASLQLDCCLTFAPPLFVILHQSIYVSFTYKHHW